MTSALHARWPPLDARGPVSSVLACVALCAPMLLAFNVPPSSTFLNQAAALIGWGAWLTSIAWTLRRPALPTAGGLWALQSALALLGLAAFASPLWAGLPWGLSLADIGFVAAAAVTVQCAAAAQREGLAAPVFRAFCIGLVVAGVASSAIGIVQVFAPGWADGDWVARTYVAGRAVGNMRQPNHLSSLLLWSVVAVLWLGEARVVRRGLSALLALLFIFVVVLSASRTGALSVCLLSVWGLADRRLCRATRTVLVLAPVAYGLFWLGTSAWADYGHHLFGGETRFSTKGDVSSSRWGIWSNTLELIRMHPWSGVGFGEFNFAWTLTPFPGRPVAFFDHTHNLVLQFAVELGVPLAALVLALLAWALWCAGVAAARTPASSAPGLSVLKSAAFVMVVLILVHSQLEYPLWYAYYLLPGAFAFGLCLTEAAGGTDAAPVAGTASPNARRSFALPMAAFAVLLGGAVALADYARVVVIFAPPEGASPLAERIRDGQHSWFFAHQADYAAATTAARPSDALPAFRRATHLLLDARLMQAWATALDESGDTQRARYLAQRLREFNNAQAEPFFEPCQTPAATDAAPPFQCTPATEPLSFESFR
jgi:O-antigen ligase